MMRIACVLAMLCALASGGAGAQTLAQLHAAGHLTAGVVVDLAPFGMLDAGGQPAGLDIDVVRDVGACLGLPVELVQVNGSNRIPFLLTGKVDILASALAITPERSKQVLFSAPYVAVDNVVIGRRDVAMHTVADLAGRRTGVPRSSTQEVALEQQAPPSVRLLHFEDNASTVQALLSGQVDAIATPVTIFGQIDAATPDTFEVKFSLFVQKNALAMRLGQAEFAAAVDKCLADGSAKGTWPALYRTWFKAEMPPL